MLLPAFYLECARFLIRVRSKDSFLIAKIWPAFFLSLLKCFNLVLGSEIVCIELFYNARLFSVIARVFNASLFFLRTSYFFHEEMILFSTKKHGERITTTTTTINKNNKPANIATTTTIHHEQHQPPSPNTNFN